MGFGSSKSKSNQASQNSSQAASTSLNQAYPFLQEQLSGEVGKTTTGTNAIASLLGLGGSDDQTAAFDQYKDSSGYNFVQDQGVKGITGSMASKGLLGSGSALKAITSYSSNLANNFLNSYLSNLMGISDSGIKAAQVLSSAGNTASSQSTSYGTSTGKSSSSSINASFG